MSETELAKVLNMKRYSNYSNFFQIFRIFELRSKILLPKGEECGVAMAAFDNIDLCHYSANHASMLALAAPNVRKLSNARYS
jgi:hypothetical protein